MGGPPPETRRAVLGLGNVVAALVGACLLPWEALGQQTTISPEVLKVARKVNRPPNSERCCCLNDYVAWVEPWVTECANSVNADEESPAERNDGCAVASCECIWGRAQAPVEEAEKATCYMRAMTQGRLTNRSKHFIPFFERICQGTLDSLNSACNRCDRDFLARGYCPPTTTTTTTLYNATLDNETDATTTTTTTLGRRLAPQEHEL